MKQPFKEMYCKVNNPTHHQPCPDSDHQLKPERKLGDYFSDEGCNGVTIVWFMKFCFIETVNQNYIFLFR